MSQGGPGGGHLDRHAHVEGAAEQVLAGFDALWIAPGSPYQSMRGALEAITFARIHDLPLLGTCGGFQHVIIGFARNVAGIPDAAHAEYDPTASRLLIDGWPARWSARSWMSP